jgi:hypothetical protein
LWQERFKGLGWFCLSRDPSPFDFAQGQNDSKNEDGKMEADFSAALRNDKQKDRQRQEQKERATASTKAKYRVLPLRQAQGQNDNG